MTKKVADRSKPCLLPKSGVSFHRHLACVIRHARISYFRSATRRIRKGALVDDIARIATWEEDAAERLDARRKLAKALKVLEGVSPRQRVAFIFVRGLYAAGLDLEPHLRDLAEDANEPLDKVRFRAERAMRTRTKVDAVRVLFPDYDPASQDAANTEWAFDKTAHRGETALFKRCKDLLAS
jgi:DNA-directed RNA polymerase specialized sigma24 family protein